MNSQNPSCQSAAPLLRTKLYPAHAEGAPLLERVALLERLLDASEQRLIVLSAPAGFGKSTVLSQLRSRLQGQGTRVAWLSCDESDSEPARFLQYLVAAVAATCPGFGSSAAALLQGEISWPLEAVIDALLDDLKGLPETLYLMLDDFHRIRHPSLGQGARYLIERLPKQVRLVVSTRYQPRFLEEPPSLGAWAFWLKAEDLRLTRAEAAAYLRKIKGLALEESELNQLYTRTEGWITALHLAAPA